MRLGGGGGEGDVSVDSQSWDLVYSSQGMTVRIGLGTEFRSEKIPRNRLGKVYVIPRKKVLIPRHSEFRGRASSEARNGIPRKEKMTLTIDKLLVAFAKK